MKNIIIAIFLFSGICVSAQTKIWEKKILTSKNIRYLAISQNGKTICVIIGGQGNDDIGRGQSSYYTDADVLISRTDTVSKPRNFKFKGGSNPTISLNGDTVYCIGFLNGNNKSLCAIPVDGDTIFTRRIISNGSDTQGKSFLCILPEVDKFLYSYAVFHSGGAEVSWDGVVDFLDRDAKLSNVGFYTDIVVRADVNPNTKKHLTSGRTVVTKDFLRIKSTSTCLVSTSTLKNSFCLPNESPFLGICSDSNYAIIGNGLFHFPTKEYIRTLDFGTNGTFMECSHLYPWYLTAKGNEVNFRRIDNDSAFYTIACAEAVMATKLSEDGKRIAVITDDSLLTVYDISSLISPQPQLHIDFTSDYKSPFKGGEIAFDMTNSYITTPTYSLIWDFGDGDISTTQHPKHTYKFPGIYTVSLTITSSIGEKYTTIKKDYIHYEKSIVPDGALWAEKHTLAAGVTAISFALRSNRILAGTSNGSIYTLTPDGQFERFLFERTYV
ncbi:MAG: PKD domain-containing protein [Bacteroidetes bacterium]|nr:PKD domain-containing protein [Bacteroidota bacterium]